MKHSRLLTAHLSAQEAVLTLLSLLPGPEVWQDTAGEYFCLVVPCGHFITDPEQEQLDPGGSCILTALYCRTVPVTW